MRKEIKESQGNGELKVEGKEVKSKENPVMLLLNLDDRNKIVQWICEKNLPYLDTIAICSCLNNLKLSE